MEGGKHGNRLVGRYMQEDCICILKMKEVLAKTLRSSHRANCGGLVEWQGKEIL